MERMATQKLTGRPATVAVAALVAILFMSSTVLTPLYVIYEDRFAFSRVTLTLISAIYVIGNVAAVLVMGRVSDRMGRRRISLAAMAIAAVSALMFLCAAGTAWLFWARLISGFAVGLGAGTATAWIAELDADADRGRAAVIATASNFFGLAMGPLVAGLLSQYAPLPLHLSFIVYLLLLSAVAVMVARTKETVARPRQNLGEIVQRPRLAVPSAIRTRFVAPAATVFGVMALVGFYAALLPSILADQLGQANHAVAGAVVFEMTLVVAVTILITRALESHTAMASGLALMLPGPALLVIAQSQASMAILLAGTAVSGISAALGYRGSLQVINQIAPEDRRAEVVSSYFVAGFIGNSIPVIGVGLITRMSDAVTASLVFAVTIAGFAVVALAFELRSWVAPWRGHSGRLAPHARRQ